MDKSFFFVLLHLIPGKINNYKTKSMIRRILSLVVIAVMVASCGNTGNKEAAVKQEGESGSVVQFASLAENPDNYLGKTITVEGKVVHVCTHSGKKLFIVGENPDFRL